MRISFSRIGGIDTRILEDGEGTPLLLLHPVGFSADIWVRNIPALARSFRVYAPDLLGHGFTDLVGADGTIGYRTMLDHLTALVDAHQLDSFSIAGSSFGSQLGTLLYFRMPHRVRRLIVVGSATTVQPADEVVAALGKTRANASKAFASPSWDSCRTRLANLCHDPNLDFSVLILSQLTAYARAGAAEAYDALLSAISDPETARRLSLRHRLGEIAVPTLLLWGKNDPRANYERAVEAAGLIPDSRLSILDACGHLPFFEHPDAFNRIVTDFLLGR